MKLLRTEVIIFVALLVTLVFVPIAGATGDELHAAPTNPEFIRYVNDKPYDSQVQDGTHGLGLIPSPIYRPEVRDIQMFGSNAGDRSTSYPPTYDLRTYNKVSPVKDQGYFGTCWAFATYGSLESTLMPATPTPDFSEKNLANLAGFDIPPSPQDGGGDMWMSAAYLARWNGPVDSATDPYPTTSIWSLSDTYPPVKHVQNVVFFPARTNWTDTGNIKGALIRWGAVYSSFYWGNTFYNAANTSYYQPASASDPPEPLGGGHAVTIVGWDDTYAATNFNTPPEGPGAWIVKNSWGTTWGDNGYFYMSYYDKYFGSALQSSTSSGDAVAPYGPDAVKEYSTAVFLGESTSNYTTIYSYDKLGEVKDYSYGTNKTGSFANVFTANFSEIIKAVGFYTTDLNVSTTISIYKNPTSGPVGGTPAATFSETLPYMGYNTVIIPSSLQVPVTTGDKFSVVVQVTNPTNDYYIPIEENLEEYTSGIVSQSGQGYMLGSSEWTDLERYINNSHVCVKAYTSSTVSPVPVANFTGTPTSGTAPLTVIFSDSSTGSPTSWSWNFGDSSLVNATVKDPVHTYTSAGTYTVSLTATNSAGSNTRTRTGYIIVTNATSGSKTGVYRPGVGFYLKMDNSNAWNSSNDLHLTWDNAADDRPISGDWDGEGTIKTGVYRPGDGFYLKMDNINSPWNSNDLHLTWDNAALDLPVAGDWNNDGYTETGVYRPGVGFFLKMDKPSDNTAWNPVTDLALTWDTAALDLPVAGDWNNDGTSETGVYRPGDGFYLKKVNSNTWEPSTDLHLTWDNAALDLPIAGDWDGEGTIKTGVYRPGDGFYLKMDNSNTWNSTDLHLTWDNAADDLPVAGRFTTSPGSGNWTFIVFGDSRDSVANTTTGISPLLSPIATAVAAENPELVLFNGDLIVGWCLTNESPMFNNYTGQFGYWKEAVSPVYNYTTGTGIPLYVIRGNHEDGFNETIPALLEAYLNSVAYNMPVNGPPGEKYLTYSFTHKGAKFIIADQYIAHGGFQETMNQSWVDEQLTQDTKPFMFVSGHSPAYRVDNETENMATDIASHPAQRDIFWTSLVNNRVPAYFCGHSHKYVRGETRSVSQMVVGNGGAGPMIDFDPANVDSNLTLKYPLSVVPANDQKVGYLVITVHEDSGTFDGVQKVLNPVTNMWEVGDTFTIYAR